MSTTGGTVSAPRPGLAQQIEDWLWESRTGRSKQVDTLINDLRHGHNIKTWAGVEYERILPLRYRGSRLVEWCTAIRNLFVFLPIGLTWLALMEASTSFAKSVEALRAADEEAQINFLDHWQSIEGWARFSTVALVDVVIIGVIVLLTGLVGWFDVSSRRAERLEMQHGELMISLERELSEYRYLSAAEIGVAMSGTLNSLLNTSQMIEVAAASLNSAGQTAFQAVAQVQQVTADVFQPLVAQLQTTLDALTPAVGAHQQMVDLVTQSRSQLAAQLDATRIGFDTIIHKVDAESQRMVQSVESGLRMATDSIGQAAMKVSVDLAARTAADVSSIAGSVQSATARLDDSLRLVADTFTAMSQDTAKVINAIQYGIGQIRNDLDNLNFGGKLGPSK